MTVRVKGKSLTAINWQELLKPKTLSPSEMVDILGDVKAELKLLALVEGFLKETITATQDEDEFEFDADRFHVIRVAKTRFGLSKDMVLEDMGQEWVEKHSSTTEYFEMRVVPIKEK